MALMRYKTRQLKSIGFQFFVVAGRKFISENCTLQSNIDSVYNDHLILIGSYIDQAVTMGSLQQPNRTWTLSLSPINSTTKTAALKKERKRRLLSDQSTA